MKRQTNPDEFYETVKRDQEVIQRRVIYKSIPKTRLRSAMFFGEEGFIVRGDEKEDTSAGAQLDKFLLAHPGIDVKSTQLVPLGSDENPTKHAILLLYKEKKSSEEITEEFKKLLNEYSLTEKEGDDTDG